ncbi:hypothetical protein [Domibacillus robiginosus]|uniref:hypothetical protein n=1 Tax=Domibacillus robiginosus TaxID=1071054 RepID=UPI000B1D21AF|nr:hypothetical protein [Domibacillus robiginosus]
MQKKFLFPVISAFLSLGLLSACNGSDDNEPDPTEEPSEQQQQNHEEHEEEND